MSTLASILGWIVLLILSIALLLAAFGYCTMKLESLLVRYRIEVEKNALHDAGRSLQGDAHWFGESSDVSLAIKILGDSLVNEGACDVSQWRQRWREQRKVMP